jgi:glycosyltransferase involved in cell wall biosynthesis
MRLLHVYSGNLFGGIESVLLTLAKGRSLCTTLDHEFALCFEGRLASALRQQRSRVHSLGPVRVSRPSSARTARRALAELLRTAVFDRVVCHGPWSQAIFGGIVRRARVPLVFFAHNIMTGRHWTERLARRVAPDAVICNSHFTRQTLGVLYPGARSWVVYAPVDVPGPLDGAVRLSIRESLRTSTDTVVIAQACRSEPSKGHELLLSALSQLRDVPNWVWWQIGGAQRRDEAAFLDTLSSAVGRSGLTERVRWIGERDDVPRLLAAADVYCQPNLTPESFGIAFVEALGAGLPVVTAGWGGAAEIVDETCGILVPPNDRDALASALRRLIVDGGYRFRLAVAAPARARHLCDPATQLGRLGEALAEAGAAEVGA